MPNETEVNIRCTPMQKAAWEEAAGPRNLSRWAREWLDECAAEDIRVDAMEAAEAARA